MQLEKTEENTNWVIEELMKELTYMRSLKQQCQLIKKEIGEVNGTYEEMMKKQKIKNQKLQEVQLEQEIIRKILQQKEIIVNKEDKIKNLKEEGQKLRSELSNLQNIKIPIESPQIILEKSLEIPLVIEQVKSQLEKSQQTSQLLIKLQNTQEQNSNIQWTIDYLSEGIESLRKDLEQAKFQILYYERLIKKSKYEQNQLFHKSQKCKNDIHWLESLLQERNEKGKQIQQEIWLMREGNCDLRSVNYELKKRIDKNSQNLQKLESERMMLEDQLKKLKKQNRKIQKAIEKRAKLNYSEDSDATVIKTPKKSNKYNQIFQ